MPTIPLTADPSQEVTVNLSGRACRLWVRQLSTGLHLDLWLDETPAIRGAICLNGVDLIRNPASPLPGRLYFTDTQGNADPYYGGIGDRFFLNYDGGAE